MFAGLGHITRSSGASLSPYMMGDPRSITRVLDTAWAVHSRRGAAR